MNAFPNSDRLSYAPSSPADLAPPLDFLMSEHDRYRLCCDTLVRLVDDPAAASAPQAAASVLEFIEVAMPLHVADEEEDLFPLLKRARRIGMDIGHLLDRLCWEHDDGIESGRWLIKPLRRITAGATDVKRYFHQMPSFILFQHHHLELEDTLLLPLANEWLSEDELGELWRGMVMRRGLMRLE